MVQNTRVWRSVRIHESIHAEVAGMRIFPVVTAITVEGFLVRLVAVKVDRMVGPFPDEGSDKGIMGHHKVVVGLDITGTVPHGVDVFTEDERLLSGLTEIQFLNLFYRGIHAAPHVEAVRIIVFLPIVVPIGLVVEWPARIELTSRL